MLEIKCVLCSFQFFSNDKIFSLIESLYIQKNYSRIEQQARPYISPFLYIELTDLFFNHELVTLHHELKLVPESL